MSCDGRYAEAWEYLSFWCSAQLLTGSHEGDGPADADLLDDSVDFLNAGAKFGKGQICYNVTQATEGEIAAATSTTLTVTGVSWDAGDEYLSAFVTTSQRSRINHNLNITSGDISMALASVGACSCNLSSQGARYLAEINIMLARVYYNCPCSPTLSPEDKRLYSELAESRLAGIRDLTVPVCEGETGKNTPLIGWAEVAQTELSAAQILLNDLLRSR